MITLLSLQYLIKSIFYDRTVVYNFSQLIFYILNYSKLKILFFFIFLILTGLPPVFLFFIKLNFLLEAINHLNIILILLITVFFFLNMLFYIQIFVVRNVKFNYSIKVTKKKKLNYKIIYLIVSLLLIQIISVFFLTDIYFILHLIINWPH